MNLRPHKTAQILQAEPSSTLVTTADNPYCCSFAVPLLLLLTLQLLCTAEKRENARCPSSATVEHTDTRVCYPRYGNLKNLGQIEHYGGSAHVHE
jgi:hypothetical protein